MEEMHEELTKFGRAGCQTGVIWLGRRLGMLVDSKPARGAHSHMVKLGKEQGQYWLLQNLDSVATLMSAFEEVPHLMQVAIDSGAPVDVAQACDSVMDAIGQGLDIKSKEAFYTRKTVGRKVIAYCRRAAHSHVGRHSQAA